jgi:hypothetical protein
MEIDDRTRPHPVRAVLVAERRRIGLDRHAPAHLDGPCLLEALALEAIDAANYAVMELDRLRRQYPAEDDAHVCAGALAVAVVGYADAATRHLAATGGPQLDLADVAYERTRGPVAGEYGAASYLHRDNYAELAEELADAAILAGFERDRRRHRGVHDDEQDRALARLGRMAEELGGCAPGLGRRVLGAAPPPNRPAADRHAIENREETNA